MQISFQKDTFPESSRYKAHIVVDKSINRRITTISIITDSASDISQGEAKNLNIRVLPITIIFDGKDYLDGVSISHDDFYKRLTIDKEFPKTAQINPAVFENTFQEEIGKGNEVLCIALGAKLSGTYQSAHIAAHSFSDKVCVVDSDNVCIAQRNLVFLALKDIQEGKKRDEIKEHLDQKKKDLVIMAAVDTLEYLERGRRISKAAAFFGSMLSIKPVVAVKEGEVKLIGKARGYMNAHSFSTKEQRWIFPYRMRLPTADVTRAF